jgi:predicted RNase H-like HicB family nuclease
MKFRVIIEPDEDGVFVAHCPALPGCISQGAIREEAQANIKEAGAWEREEMVGSAHPTLF